MTQATVAGLRLAALAVGALLAAPVLAQGRNDFDPDNTRLGFELRTRWGQVLDGVFRHYEGSVEHLPDGRQQVRLRAARTAAVHDRTRRSPALEPAASPGSGYRIYQPTLRTRTPYG